MILTQIFTTIPNSVLIEVQNLNTAKEVWEAMCAKHETKALPVKIDMRCQMYELKCKDESNIHMHLESLMKMQEQLAGMNAALTNDDLVTIILRLLPMLYHSLINVIMLSVAHTKDKLELDQVVSTLIDKV